MTLKLTFFLLLSLTMSWLQAAELGQVTPDQLQSMQQHNHALVIDIRTAEEWKSTGIIPDSRPLQAFSSDGSFDAAKWLAELQMLKTSPDQAVILVCRSGNRSSKAGKFLIEQGMVNVYHLSHGIQSWTQSGHPIINDKSTIPNR